NADEIISIRTKDGAIHLPVMAVELAHRRAGRAVEESYCAVSTSIRDQLTVRTESGGVRIVIELRDNLLRARVPQSHLVIHRARDDKLAIVTKFRVRDFRTMLP